MIGLTLDEVHVFGDNLGTLDGSLELVLDLFDMPRSWTSICVGKGEPWWWIVESEVLQEKKWIKQENRKVVCPSGSRRENPDLGFPCLLRELWLGDLDESRQYICRGCS